jgi:hypothetical protein
MPDHLPCHQHLPAAPGSRNLNHGLFSVDHSEAGAFVLAEKQVIMGLVKDGKLIGISDPIQAGLSHAQMAERLGLKLENGKPPKGVEGFFAEKRNGQVKIIGAGIQNFKISPETRKTVEGTVN